MTGYSLSLAELDDVSSQQAWDVIDESQESFHASSSKHGHSSVPELSRNVAPLKWGDIEIHNLIGSGAFCEVYEVKVINHSDEGVAIDSKQKHHALKCIHSAALKDFSRGYLSCAADLATEVAILSSLDHENIVRIFGSNSSDDPNAAQGCFFVMELLEETLKDRLARWQRAPSQIFLSLKKAQSHATDIKGRIKSCVIGVCDALKYLHRKRLVYRDLKPANVGFLSGTVKLFDFGLTRYEDDCQHSTAGSLRYMAPETMLGQGSTMKSDLYSFGILFYQIVTLKRPNDKYKKKSQLIQSIAKNHERPIFRKALPSRSLARLIRACWDPDPNARPTLAEVRVQLDEISRELNVAAKIRTPREGHGDCSLSQSVVELDDDDESLAGGTLSLPRLFRGPKGNLSTGNLSKTSFSSMSDLSVLSSECQQNEKFKPSTEETVALQPIRSPISKFAHRRKMKSIKRMTTMSRQETI